MQGMPTPTDDHKRLYVFAGTFAGDETISPSPWGPGGPAVGRYSGQIVCDGFFVTQQYAEEKDGQVSFRGHGVFGWDAQRRQVAWYWVDSMGAMPERPSYGSWDGDMLRLHSESAHGQGRYTFELHGPDRYRFTLEGSFDGGATWLTQMTGDYQRVP